MRPTLAPLALVTALLAGPALADIKADAKNFAEGRELIAEFYADLDLDGEDEAVLHFADNCGALGCEWALLTMYDGDAVQVGSGEAETVSLRSTPPMGAVIEADGVFWAFDGEVYPHYSFLERPDAREIPPSLDDRQALIVNTDWGDASRESLHVWSVDVTGDGSRERIITVGDLAYSMGGTATPYLILSRSGDMLAKGYSMDFPRIFTNPAGGARVVEIMPRAITEKQIGR